MNLFDRLVQQAMRASPELTSLRAVVEKADFWEYLIHLLQEETAGAVAAVK